VRIRAAGYTRKSSPDHERRKLAQAGKTGACGESRVSPAAYQGTVNSVSLPSVAAVADMVAPVVLITTGVLMANGILATYTSVNDHIQTLRDSRLGTSADEKLREIDRQLSAESRRARLLLGAVLTIFGGIALLVLSVVGIGMAEVHRSETVGAAALGLVIAGLVTELGGLMVVAAAYAPRRRP
jgi:Protein of unknown function (DUF2721)